MQKIISFLKNKKNNHKILLVGNLIKDLIMTIDNFPAENSEGRAKGFTMNLGGNATNSAIVLHHLGEQPYLVASASNQDKGIDKLLQRYSLQSIFLERKLGKTPISIILNNLSNGSRTIRHFRDLPELSFEHFAKIEFEQFNWLHFEGRNIDNLIVMLNFIHKFSPCIPVSLEAEKYFPKLEQAFGLVNYLIISKEYAIANGITQMQDVTNLFCKLRQKLKINIPQMLCCWGNEGVVVDIPSQPKSGFIPAIKINSIDSRGAGDTFNAALISALSNNNSLLDAANIANCIAARKCTVAGLDNIFQNLTNEAGVVVNIQQLSKTKTTHFYRDGVAYFAILDKNSKPYLYENICPHQNTVLDKAYKIEVNPSKDLIKCSLHNASFKISNGKCVAGPCLNQYLKKVKFKVLDNGNIILI